jgi:demethylmenaquinone methyltransferase/2-methoxy-6-polyprenyl-1,4-benzoquinol methylase
MPLALEGAPLPIRVFAPVAHGYDRAALLLSLGQYRRWHRALLSVALAPAGAPDAAGIFPARPLLALDMATGTGAIALDLLRRPGVRVVGADITRPMLLEAQGRAQRLRRHLPLIQCTAEAPPFRDGAFDAVLFAYLLRYVDDVPSTLSHLVRLLRPGGVMAALDFGVPEGIWRPLWRLYTDVALPVLGRLFSPAWGDVGRFLGPSIRGFYREWPLPRLLEAWSAAGLTGVRCRRLSLGGGVIVWGRRPG